jgi:OmpA-OmpF porin, OOP family
MLNAQRIFNRGLALAAAAFALAACASTSSLDELANTTPSGSPFTQQLFKNYSYLANSFGAASDDDGGIFDTGSDTGDLAEAFATKALIAARGTEPAPEPGTDDASSQARARLMAALAQGKDHFPVDAARAQVDFDCWMLNATVESQAAAAAQCRDSFGQSIARLEADLHPAPVAAPPPPAPVATAAPANYTVYFDFDSWTLSGEQLTVLQQAINAARAGQQTHITVVGHTDTSGSADYNQGLSVKRANVVKDVLVQMGARPDSIQASGVGETDLAVQTKDGVRERQNRRSVITLLP